MNELMALLESVEENGELRLKLSVDLLASTVDGLRDALRARMECSAQTVVLDLSNVQKIDSLGVSLVVGLFKSCRARNVGFRVDCAIPELLRVFRLFRLNQFFTIAEA